MPWCEKCDELIWALHHKCPPVFECWDEGYLLGDDQHNPDNPKRIRARDHEAAAIKFAESEGGDFGGITPDDEIEVWVRRDGEIKKFKMTAEYSIDVYAEEIEE